MLVQLYVIVNARKGSFFNKLSKGFRKDQRWYLVTAIFCSTSTSLPIDYDGKKEMIKRKSNKKLLSTSTINLLKSVLNHFIGFLSIHRRCDYF